MNTRINDFLSVIEISQDTVDFAIEYSPDIYGYIRLNTQKLYETYICEYECWRRNENYEHWIDFKLFIRNQQVEKLLNLLSKKYEIPSLYQKFCDCKNGSIFFSFEREDNYQIVLFKNYESGVIQIVKFDE